MKASKNLTMHGHTRMGTPSRVYLHRPSASTYYEAMSGILLDSSIFTQAQICTQRQTHRQEQAMALKLSIHVVVLKYLLYVRTTSVQYICMLIDLAIYTYVKACGRK